jgi:Domain of unknown function (DUF1905)
VKSKRFETELIEGHKGVVAAIIPFDPETSWRRRPVALAGRRHGWPVTGTLNGKRLEGYIGERWGRFFIMIEDSLRERAAVDIGDTVNLVLAPSTAARIHGLAIEQSKITTQPSRAHPRISQPPRRRPKRSHT